MIDKNGLVSIIVPVYNAENYLRNCIASVLNQSYTYWELILVNDGSTDKSGDICEYFSKTNEKITVIHKANAGVSSSRNVGIDCAKGDYISFLDSDDSLPEDSLEILMRSITTNNADVAGGVIYSKYRRKRGDVEVWKGKEGIKNSLMDNPFTYSACGKVFRRDIIGECRFNNDIKVNEDSFFVFQIMCKKPSFVCVNQAVYCYRDVPGSASRSAFSEKYFDILKVSKSKYDIVWKEYPELLNLAENMKLKSEINLLYLLMTRTYGKYRKMESELVKKIQDHRDYYISQNGCDDSFFKIIVQDRYNYYKYGVRVKVLIKRLISRKPLRVKK